MTAPEPRRIYLVDGTAQLYRAYFAIRGLSTRDGLPTNAVYGFATMLRKFLADERPRHVGVAFDLGRRVFRHERFAEYKAHRPPTPEDLVVQVPYAKQVCDAFGVARLELQGFEADDLIATCARRARAEGFAVVIVASDKDLYQLVGEGVTVFNPSKNEWLDAEGVARSFGVAPDRVRDVLGLMGDSVDNIPGVPGVGPKTAVALVATYGSLESIVERALRFTRAFDARDALLLAIDAPDPAGLGQALGAFTGSVTALLEVEAGDPARASLTTARELASNFDRDGAGRAELKRGLRALDRGSSRRVWTAIHDHAEQAKLSQELATLSADAPLDLDLDRLVRFEPDRQGAVALFRRLEFRALADEVAPGDTTGAGADAAPATETAVVTSREGLRELARFCRESASVAVAVASTGGEPLRSSLVGLAIAGGGGRAFYVPVAHDYLGAPAQLALEAVGAELAGVLADPGLAKVGHDVKAASHLLRRHGLPVAGFTLDTMVAAFLVDASRSSFDLARVVEASLGRALARPDPEGSPGGVEVDRVAAWLGERAAMVRELAAALEAKLADDRLLELYRTIDGPLLPLLERMEAHGIRVDTVLLGRMSAEMAAALDTARAEIHALAGGEFNVDSPKQLREVLFVKLGLRPGRKTAKGREASTDAQTLEELTEAHPIAARILEYRELAKLKGTYVDALPRLVAPDTGRVHTTFNPTGAATGRLSSSDPNLQNIPARTAAGRRIRAAFVPDDGQVFLASDYSQIELRVLAHMTGDPELIAAFRAGEDIHRRTAARIFDAAPDLVTDEMRRRAKVVNFGILYGMSETRLAREQGIPRKDARRFIETYFERFAKVRAYIDEVRERARREGEVRTLFGRLRRFPELGERARRDVEEQALRAAVNTTIQGTAADLMKMAMLAVDRDLARAGLPARILLQVHDELLLEVPEHAAAAVGGVVRAAMEGVHHLDVPLVVDQKVGRSWMDVT